MGREVRRVPADWQHPRRGNGDYIPLKDKYEDALQDFQKDIDEKGLGEALDYWGGGPVSYDYMLVGTPESERTHYMMYEDTSEGTPKSPAFATPEELAQWLVDNNASWFGGNTASYEIWLHVARGGYHPSLVMVIPNSQHVDTSVPPCDNA